MFSCLPWLLILRGAEMWERVNKVWWISKRLTMSSHPQSRRGCSVGMGLAAVTRWLNWSTIWSQHASPFLTGLPIRIACVFPLAGPAMGPGMLMQMSPLGAYDPSPAWGPLPVPCSAFPKEWEEFLYDLDLQETKKNQSMLLLAKTLTVRTDGKMEETEIQRGNRFVQWTRLGLCLSLNLRLLVTWTLSPIL